MAEAKTAELQKISTSVVKLASITREDLTTPEKVSAIVSTASRASAASKEAGELYNQVKAKMKNLCKEETDKGRAVTIYDYAAEEKFSVSVGSDSATVDDEGLWKEIAQIMNEDPENMTVENPAWTLFLSLTDPISAFPREINETKVNEYVKNNPLFKNVLKKHTQVKKGTISAGVKSMSKQEKEAHASGELVDIKIVEKK